MSRVLTAWCRTAPIAVGIALLTTISPSHTFAEAREDLDDFASPLERGPFNVGISLYPAIMTGGRLTLIQVFYPTLAASDQDSKYTIFVPAGSYQVRSPLGAVRNAAPAPGLFPMVVHDHGGLVGADFHRIEQVSLHETMASHGLVTVVALHASTQVARARDLPLVIDSLLARSADRSDLLADSIDPDRIGISGYSAGGAAALSSAGGWVAHGIVPDARIRAMVLYEPGIDSLDDARTISIPYLAMGGSQSQNGLSIPPLFEATANAKRYYVLTPSATHFNYCTDIGAEIDETREAALHADPDMPEPLIVRTATNAAADRAYYLWHQGQILFPFLGAGAGSGRNFCDRVGVDSIRSLDADKDGFTDSPPFMASDACTLQPAIREEVMVPLIKQYTIAFWKLHLQGDDRYKEYLTPGYAEQNHLEALVSFAGNEGEEGEAGEDDEHDEGTGQRLNKSEPLQGVPHARRRGSESSRSARVGRGQSG